MDIKPASIIKTGQSDGIIAEAKNYDLLIAGMKSGALKNKPARIINKILDSHELNAIVVQ
ncbi:MAG: hypothetical protein HZB61_12330 [Nitrospirae bacterium]|nr:hypothetical protein [Nitrospirota bacterium]